MATRLTRSTAVISVIAGVLLPCLRAQTTTRESVASNGLPFDVGTNSRFSGVSADGRYLVFDVPVPVATTYVTQIMRRDRQLGVTEVASLAPNGDYGNADSIEPSFSLDGRWLAFASYATNFVPNTTTSASRIYVRDLVTSTNTMESPGLGGATPNGLSSAPRITPDGHYVVFFSDSSNLVSGDTNGVADVFVRDRQAGTLSRVSVGSGGQANGTSLEASISDDGRFVAFESLASNLVASDTNGTFDVFVRDRVLGATTRVDRSAGGAELALGAEAPLISGDGRFVAYASRDAALIPGDVFGGYDIIVHDLVTGTNDWASPGSSGQISNGDSYRPNAISPDGRFVVFSSGASDLVSGDTNNTFDVFLRDRTLAVTERVNVTTTGEQVPQSLFTDAHLAALSPDGRYVAFSDLGDLVIGSYSGFDEIYLRDRQGTATTLESYCTAKVNSASCTPMISASGLPSVSGATAFTVTASRVLRNKSGLFFWGLQAAAIPFGGGTLCVQPPVVRLPTQDSGGTFIAGNCSGHYFFPFSPSYMASYGLAAGQTIHAQFWSRDTGFSPPNNIGLTDALRFTLGL
ncbi:MAG: PD40 domain-containing protein [Planctomycetes bacterium]|nr:PD40 domain-containing protein [Planctomycetota bacterium]